MTLRIEVEREDDGRWLAEVLDLPGVITYGPTEGSAVSRVQAPALRVIADRIDHAEIDSAFMNIVFTAA